MSTYEKILIVADFHGDISFLKIVIDKAEEYKCDAIIQLGDFGYWPSEINFPGMAPSIPIYFIDGNHEEHSRLNQTVEYTEVSENVFHIARGTFLKIGNMNCLGIGGAYSIDRHYRIEGISWFKEEEITESDLSKCLNHKDKFPLDLIFSHDIPLKLTVTKNSYVGSYHTREKLDILLDNASPKYWFFGHYHLDYRNKFRSTEFIGLPSNIEVPSRAIVFDCSSGKIISNPQLPNKHSKPIIRY